MAAPTFNNFYNKFLKGDSESRPKFFANNPITNSEWREGELAPSGWTHKHHDSNLELANMHLCGEIDRLETLENAIFKNKLLK